MNRLTATIANACLGVVETRGAMFPEGPPQNRAAVDTWIGSLELGQIDADRVNTTISSVYFDSGRLPIGMWMGSIANLRTAVEACHPNLSFNVSEFRLAIEAVKEANKIIQIGAGAGRFLVVYDLSLLSLPDDDTAATEANTVTDSVENLATALAEAVGAEMSQIEPQEASMVILENENHQNHLENETYQNQHNALVRSAVEAARAGRHNEMHDHMVSLLRLRHARNNAVAAGPPPENVANPNINGPSEEGAVNGGEAIEGETLTTVIFDEVAPVQPLEGETEAAETGTVSAGSAAPAVVSEVALPVQSQPEVDPTNPQALMAQAERQLSDLSNTISTLRSALRSLAEENYILKRATWQ